MVGIRWKAWKTMPILAPRNPPAHLRSASPERRRRSSIEPLSARSRPAIVISKVDLPEPEGPTSPTASPRAISRLILRRIWTRAAPRPKLKSKSRSSIAGSAIAGLFQMSRRVPTYGHCLARVQLLAAGLIVAARSSRVAGARPHDKGRGARRQPDRRPRPAAGAGISRRCWKRRCAPRVMMLRSAMPGFPARRRATALRATTGRVPDGTDALIVELGANDMLRGLDPAAAKAVAGRDPDAGEGRAYRHPADRHARRAQSRRGLSGPLRSDLSRSRQEFRRPLYPFFLDGVAADPKLNQKDGLHPTREGVEKIVANILPGGRDAAG